MLLLGLIDHESDVLRTPGDFLGYGLDESQVNVNTEGIESTLEGADGPLAEGVLLATEFIAQAYFVDALGAKFRQRCVEEFAIRAEFRVGRVA